MFPLTPRFCDACGGRLMDTLDLSGQGAPLACDNCGRPVYLDPKVAVALIAEMDGGVVMLRRAQHDRAHGLWILPGGHVDRGEVVEKAGLRELGEETGLAGEISGLVGVYSFPGNPWVLLVYRARVTGGRLRGGREALETAVFPPERLPWSELGYPSTEHALKDYLAQTGRHRP